MLETHDVSIDMRRLVLWREIQMDFGEERIRYAINPTPFWPAGMSSGVQILPDRPRFDSKIMWPFSDGFLDSKIVWPFSNGFLVVWGWSANRTFAVRGPFDATTSVRKQLVAQILSDDDLCPLSVSLAKLF
jgi:hypothetical protein